MGSTQSTSQIAKIVLPIKLSNPKVVPTSLAMKDFFKRNVWNETVAYVFQHLPIPYSAWKKHTLTYANSQIVLTFQTPVQLSSRDVAMIKEGFHKATNAGDVRLRVNGHWYTIFFNYNSIYTIPA